jgi:DNA-binding CsgD family transcriptional regulator
MIGAKVPVYDSAAPTLTPREAAIARLMEQKKSPKEIAAELGVGRGMVKNYMSRIRLKLGWNDGK